jgi:hypothetical protein
MGEENLNGQAFHYAGGACRGSGNHWEAVFMACYTEGLRHA